MSRAKQEPPTLLSLAEPGDRSIPTARSTLARLILRAGRPVVVAPRGTGSLSGRNVMVAWKDAREARRAVRDALPFLQDAETILLLEVVEGGMEQQALQRLKDVRHFLENMASGRSANACERLK
jgi:hypothetical protein